MDPTDIVAILKSLPIGGVSFGGLVSLAIVLLFRGDLLPRSSVEKIVQSKDDQIHTLTSALEISEKARTTGAEADKELLELGRTTVHLLESIHDKADEVKT